MIVVVIRYDLTASVKNVAEEQHPILIRLYPHHFRRTSGCTISIASILMNRDTCYPGTRYQVPWYQCLVLVLPGMVCIS